MYAILKNCLRGKKFLKLVIKCWNAVFIGQLLMLNEEKCYTIIVSKGVSR